MNLPSFLTKIPLTKTLSYVCAALLAANVGQFIRAEFQSKSLALADAQLDRTNFELQLCQATNERNSQVIVSLRDANAKWAATARLAEADRVSALEAVAQSARTLSSLRASAASQKLDGPNCDQFLEVAVERSCPLLVDRLRSYNKTSR